MLDKEKAMIPACTLSTIQSTLSKMKVSYSVKAVAPNDGAFVLYQMGPVTTDHITPDQVREKDRIIGILLARPAHKIAREEILNDLENFHVKSGDSIDFFLPGYGAYWDDRYSKDKQVVATIRDTDWYFSNILFVQFVHELEKSIKWRYSGECELLLLSVDRNSSDSDPLSFSAGITINITELINDKLISSVANLFYKIFNAVGNNRDLSLRQLSNQLALANGQKAFFDFLSIIPKADGLIQTYGRLKQYAVKAV